MVPSIGSVANVSTAASGAATAQRRNATTRVQLSPNRTGGFYTGGSVAIDPSIATTLASGFSVGT